MAGIEEIEGFIANPLVELEFSGVQRAQINACMQHWFAAVNKRQCPDLERRVNDLKRRLSMLALQIKFKYEFVDGSRDTQLVAYADGEGQETLRMIKSGTLWFDRWKSLEYEVMLAATDCSSTLPQVAKTLGSTIAR